jgi:hypothetical protein
VNRSKRSLNLSGYRHKWPFCILWASKPLMTDTYNPMWYVPKFHSCPLKALCDESIARGTFGRLSHIPANVKFWGSPRQSRGFTPINYVSHSCLLSGLNVQPRTSLPTSIFPIGLLVFPTTSTLSSISMPISKQD